MLLDPEGAWPILGLFICTLCLWLLVLGDFQTKIWIQLLLLERIFYREFVEWDCWGNDGFFVPGFRFSGDNKVAMPLPLRTKSVVGQFISDEFGAAPYKWTCVSFSEGDNLQSFVSWDPFRLCYSCSAWLKF